MYEQINERIWPPCPWIALLDYGDIFSGNVEAGDDVDRTLIDFRIGDIAVIRAPPIARVAAHLFLRDELGYSVGNGFVRLGQRR